VLLSPLLLRGASVPSVDFKVTYQPANQVIASILTVQSFKELTVIPLRYKFIMSDMSSKFGVGDVLI
jgi:hypothetical protein